MFEHRYLAPESRILGLEALDLCSLVRTMS
jgi:hypothetical protein